MSSENTVPHRLQFDAVVIGLTAEDCSTDDTHVQTTWLEITADNVTANSNAIRLTHVIPLRDDQGEVIHLRRSLVVPEHTLLDAISKSVASLREQSTMTELPPASTRES